MYNKLFTKILDSSIWLAPDPHRLVWITLIAAMDEHGNVNFASIGNIAARARVTREQAAEAVAAFEGPDPDSGDPDNEGRRIERFPGGWHVLNAHKYRALVTKAIIQEQTRARVAKHRAKMAGVTISDDPVTHAKRTSNAAVTPSEALSEADTEAKTKTKTARKRADYSPAFQLFWDAYPNKDAKSDAAKAFDALGPSTDLLDEILLAVAAQRCTSKWQELGGKYIPHAATWIRGKRWEDQPPAPTQHRYETPRQTAAIDRAIEMTGGLLNARRTHQIQPEYIDAIDKQYPALG